jgi:hypothetical protein
MEVRYYSYSCSCCFDTSFTRHRRGGQSISSFAPFVGAGIQHPTFCRLQGLSPFTAAATLLHFFLAVWSASDDCLLVFHDDDPGQLYAAGDAGANVEVYLLVAGTCTIFKLMP